MTIVAKGPDCSGLTLHNWLALNTSPVVADLLVAVAVVTTVVVAAAVAARAVTWAQRGGTR